MISCRILLVVAVLSAPVEAQSAYVLELSRGQLAPAESTEGIAPAAAVASAARGGPITQGDGSSTPRAASGHGRARNASSVEDGLYFRSCDEAAKAGYSSMRVGTPGYREGLDGDYDGIACEPYLSRR
jgi:hypothetical protein